MTLSGETELSDTGKIWNVWGFGLDAATEATLSRFMPQGFRLIPWGGKYPGQDDYESDMPALIFVEWSIWTALPDERKEFLKRLENVLLVAVVPEDAGPEPFERALAEGAGTVIRRNPQRESVERLAYRSMEVRNLYDDIYKMAEEIYLERELLARKNDHLSFLNSFLARVTESLEPETILAGARADLEMLFPVSAIYAAVWSEVADHAVEAEFFLGRSRGRARKEWVEILTQGAARLSGGKVVGFKMHETPELAAKKGAFVAAPRPGSILILPLRTGSVTFGCVALQSPEKFNLGRDQVELLHSVVNHLALALNNGLLYRQVRAQADYDGLTRIHNRRHFERRLSEELARHQRYNHRMSVLMMDIDHFKNVNDSYGHQAGDLVLREFGRMIGDAVRATDCAARYGGEEFAVILPHTDRGQAWVLAERIRSAVESMAFIHEGRTIEVTVSIGVATLAPGALTPQEQLLHEADQALYLAKQNGRNMVCDSRCFAQEAVRG